jgi:hypothetical protein
MAAKKKPTAPEGVARPRNDGDESDVEGHNFMNPTTARELSRYKEAEIQRSVRERQLAKESRPNKHGR